jgi:hypothetical protein
MDKNDIDDTEKKDAQLESRREFLKTKLGGVLLGAAGRSSLATACHVNEMQHTDEWHIHEDWWTPVDVDGSGGHTDIAAYHEDRNSHANYTGTHTDTPHTNSSVHSDSGLPPLLVHVL